MPHSPLRILGIIALSVFVGEILVMFILATLPQFPVVLEAVVDSSMLIVIISPALFFFLFLPIIRHVERRKQAENNLRKNRDLLQTIFNGMSDPLLLLDEEMMVKMINTAARDYYHMHDRPVIDQPCYKALMNAERPCEECDVPRTMKENKNLTFERRGLFDPNRAEQVTIYRSDTKPGIPGTTIVRVTDVTEARILEKQVRQRERMASLGLLISGVAHEINNPNNFISFNSLFIPQSIQFKPITNNK